ncbi:MAG: phosphate ABC transporter substrate-binding protein PstS family protein [Bacteroidia bacterium]
MFFLWACSTDGVRRVENYIRIDGSSTVYPITEAVTELFYEQHKNYKVVVGVSGTGGGLRKLIRSEIDICNASRPMNEDERRLIAEAGIEVLELPVALDGIVIAVNKANDWAQDIKISELQRLWQTESQGKTIRWSDLRPEWPAIPVILFGAGPSSGTYDFFTAAVNKKARSGRGDYAASENDNILVKGISGEQAALGYFGYTYYLESKDALKVLAVINDREVGAQAVYPDSSSIRNFSYRPFTRQQYLYIRIDALQRSAVAEYLVFYLEHVGSLHSSLAFIPLPDAEYRYWQAELAKYLPKP